MPKRYRSRLSQAAFWIAVGVAAVSIVDLVIRSGWGAGLLFAPWILFAVWLAYVGIYSSFLQVDEWGVELQNGLRRWRIPWSAVATVRVQYQLRFDLDDGRTVIALGGPDRLRPERPSIFKGERINPDPAILDDLARLEELRAQAEPGEQNPPGMVTAGWDWITGGVGIALALLSVIAAVVATR